MSAHRPRSPGSPEVVRREGITVLSDPVACELDILIVHGLNGSPYHTFRDASTGFYWPSDLARSFPTARIMVFGYIADVSGGSSNNLGVYQHAESLLLHLKNNRIGSAQEKRPIAFLAHSLGGIVVKQALVISSHHNTDEQLLRSTKLICFFGTPHRGSHLLDKSFSRRGLSVMKLASKELPKNVKNMLQPRANESFIVNSDFMRVKGQISIVNFYEQVPRYPLNELVVEKDSAVLDSEYSENIPVARDHEHLVRFDSVNDDAYHTLCQTMRRKVSKILEEAATSSKDGYAERMLRACVRSLGDLSVSSNATQSKEAHHKTLSWVWAPDGELTRWLESGKGLFAITGKPGSGKSLLMNEVATQLLRRYRQRFGVLVKHAFNTRGTPREHSFDGFLRLALGQVLRQCPSSFDAMLDDWLSTAMDSGFTQAQIYDAEELDVVTWQLNNLKRALRAVVGHASQQGRICFIIDALDECDGGKEGIAELVTFLNAATKADASLEKDGVRICISCRDLPSITGPSVPSGFRMEERNGPDIAAYINDRMTALALLAGASDEMKQLKTELIQKADGIFLWAHLALERIQAALSDGATVAELREAIDDIPEELGGLFALLLASINPRYSKETDTMLAIVLSAQRPLSLREFRYVMALITSPPASSHKALTESDKIVQDDSAMRRRIHSRCGGLLEVKVVKDAWLDEDLSNSDHTYVVQFIHQSVKDYLLSSRQGSSVEKVDALTMEGHSTLAKCCIQYLSFKEVQEMASHIRSGLTLDKPSQLSHKSGFPLLTYTTEFCFLHCQEAEKQGTSHAELIDQQFGSPDSESFNNYISLYNAIHQGEKYSLGCNVLYLAVEYNIASYVNLSLSRNAAEVNILLEGGRSYLQVAVWKKHQETLQVLLKHGAEVRLPATYSHAQAVLESTEIPYESLPALVLACKHGSVEIVKMLLEHGADPADTTFAYDGMHINLALLSAAESGSLEIVQMLLEADPMTFAHAEIRLSAIAGLWYRNKDIALDKARTKDERTPLAEGAIRKVREMSQVIFGGIDLFQFDFEAFSIRLFWHLTGCHPDVLQRLVELGTDFSGAGSFGVSFMHVACMAGSVASVQTLLRNHADPHITFGDTEATCLHLSLWNETPAVLSHLLQRNLPVDEPDLRGNTPLHAAARMTTEDFIETLLRYGADRSALNMLGHRPFHLAILNRQVKDHVSLLEKLLYQESDLHLADREGLTALHIAAGRGALPVVEWLLEKGADITSRDDSGRTVLHLSATSSSPDSTETLGYLLGRGTALDVNARDGADMTPLHHVFWTYHSLVTSSEFDPAVTIANAKLLLQRGADLCAADNAGNTVLHLAAWRGVKELVRVFLRNGADPTARDSNGLRPLDLASMEDVRELLEDAMEEKARIKRHDSP